MSESTICDYLGCENHGEIISRLSPEGYLVATGKRLTHSERPIEDFTTVLTIMSNS